MKGTTVKPLGENILIHPEKPEQTTDAGIYLPDTANKERPQIGRIIAIGESDKIRVKKGQTVIFRRYVGEEMKIGGEDYIITDHKDILAIID